jgi:integrase/recombinase XerD
MEDDVEIVISSENIDKNTGSYGRHLRDFKKYIQDKNITLELIKEYFIELNNIGYSASTIKVKRAAIKRRICQLSRELPLDQRIHINGFLTDLDKDPDTKAPKINTAGVTRDMFLIHSEVENLVSMARSDRQKLFIRFLYKTGCRVAEMASIKLCDGKVMDESMVKVRILGKGSKERFIQISLSFWTEIQQTFGGKVYLFETRNGKPYSKEYISNQIKAQGKTLGKNISAHTMRHSFAMEMIKRNPYMIDAVSRYLGHADMAYTVKSYCHNELTVKELLS